jgi:hypothetical protein
MNQAQANGVRVELVRLVLTEMGYYQPQQRRPYVANLTGESMKMANEVFDNISSFQPAECAAMVSNFFDIQTQPASEAAIEGGWGKARFAFVMELKVHFPMGPILTQIVQGYTSPLPAGMTAKDYTDDVLNDLIFYFNTTYTVRNSVESTPIGEMERNYLLTPYQVLFNYEAKGLGEKSKHTLRPADVFASMNVIHLMGNEPVMDARTAFTNRPVLSSVQNNIPSHYVSKVLSSYATAAHSITTFGMSDQNELSNQARAYATEPPAERDPFFRYLSQKTKLPFTGMVDYPTLKELFASLGENTTVHLSDAKKRTTADLSSPFYQPDLPTAMAVRAHHLVVNKLRAVGIFNATLSVTNKVVDNVPVTLMSNVAGLKGYVGDNAVANVSQVLQHEFKHYLTMGNMIEFALDMNVNVHGETWVSLSVNGGPTQGFIFPSFADNTFSPVIMSSQEDAVAIAGSFETLFGSLDWLTMPQAV